LGPDIIADHCVHLDDSEIERIVNHRVNVVTNPESNMKLASGIAPVSRLISAGVTVGLGTDGCASNNNLDMFLEMDSAAKLQKISLTDPAALDALTVLKMATCNGANVLGFGDITGSLEPGKKADIIVVDTHKPHLTPLYNPYSHLVYAASGSDVRHSIINGQLVMEDRQMLTLNLTNILTLANDKASLVNQWISDV
jgi:5-methylthioadenosine/S-adenosylhomocysteine deaminase